jgi:hypothetical protein
MLHGLIPWVKISGASTRCFPQLRNQTLEPLWLFEPLPVLSSSISFEYWKGFLMKTTKYAVQAQAMRAWDYTILLIPGRIFSKIVTTSLQTLSCASLPFLLVTKGLAFLT